MGVAAEAFAHAGEVTPSVYGFLTSSGFAGLLAVIAAAIAYVAATGNARRDRWWKRAEYALDRTLSSDEAEQLVGLAMLRTLRSRNGREQDFIKAATDVFLDPNADGDDSDDDPLRSDAGPTRPSAGPSARIRERTRAKRKPKRDSTGWLRRFIQRGRRK